MVTREEYEDELKEMQMKWLEEQRKDINNFSYWFPKIKDCGIPVPKSIWFNVPDVVVVHCFMDHPDKDLDYIEYWVDDEVIPKLKNEGMLGYPIFIKNGTFSNKFDFRRCGIIGVKQEIVMSIMDINYSSEMLGAEGQCELVIRERVGLYHDAPKIYNGMKLFPEFRVFYDFDNKLIKYIVNYWDWDYCHDAICNDITDKIVYEAYYDKLNMEFQHSLTEVFQLADDHLCKVTELSGVWSVDIMKVDGQYYLIDMATAGTSAYWDPNRNDYVEFTKKG